ncbi:MAG: hypothetical protein LC808_14795 [Actinobacteria bacterium]|nr:hypothetical protein [Actinomycetota bacterium]
MQRTSAVWLTVSDPQMAELVRRVVRVEGRRRNLRVRTGVRFRPDPVVEVWSWDVEVSPEERAVQMKAFTRVAMGVGPWTATPVDVSALLAERGHTDAVRRWREPSNEGSAGAGFSR